jgi:hypothetical protein
MNKCLRVKVDNLVVGLSQLPENYKFGFNLAVAPFNRDQSQSNEEKAIYALTRLISLSVKSAEANGIPLSLSFIKNELTLNSLLELINSAESIETFDKLSYVCVELLWRKKNSFVDGKHVKLPNVELLPTPTTYLN